jgi:hypothetical protein
MATPIMTPSLQARASVDCACAAGLICASEITGKDYGIK